MTQAPDLLARLARIDCCALSDALDQLKMPGVVSGLIQGSGGGRIAGRAITVRLVAGVKSDGPPKHLCATAIEMGGPGSIIVVEQRSGIEAGSWGGLLSVGAQTMGNEGVNADGSATIFVTEKDIEKVLAAAERIVAKEDLMAKEILSGAAIGTVMGANYEHMLK